MAEYESNVKFPHICYFDLLRFNPFDLIISTNHYSSLMLDDLREGAANKPIYRSRNNVKDLFRPCCISTHPYSFSVTPSHLCLTLRLGLRFLTLKCIIKGICLKFSALEYIFKLYVWDFRLPSIFTRITIQDMAIQNVLGTENAKRDPSKCTWVSNIQVMTI